MTIRANFDEFKPPGIVRNGDGNKISVHFLCEKEKARREANRKVVVSLTVGSIFCNENFIDQLVCRSFSLFHTETFDHWILNELLNEVIEFHHVIISIILQ
jgi:hypothetical protein